MSLYQSNSTCKVLEFYKEILSGSQLCIPQRPGCKWQQYSVCEYDYGSEKGTEPPYR